MQDILRQVQVNIPFTMLYDDYLDRFLEFGLNPEIGIDFKLLFAYLISNDLPRPIITLEPHQEEDLWPSLNYLATVWPW